MKRSLFNNSNHGCFKRLGENNVSKTLLSEHLMGIPNVAGTHGVLYGTWPCDPPSGVQGQGLKSPIILRHLKPENS